MDVLRLRADLTRSTRTFGLVLVALTVPVLFGIAAVVYFLALRAGWATWIFAIPVVFFAPLVARHVQTWARTRRITHPVELSRQGMSVDSPEGRLAFGWEAVAGVAVAGTSQAPTLGVRLHPQVTPGAPGVVSTLSRRSWRVLRGRGTQIAVPVTGISAQELAAAVGRFSSGRWRPVPVG